MKFKATVFTALLLTAACVAEHQTNDVGDSDGVDDDIEFRSSVWKNLDSVPTSVKKYTLTRPNYSDSTAQSRATALAKIVMEDNTITASAQLAALIDAAQAGTAKWLPHTETGTAWPTLGVVFDYSAHTEKMTVYSPYKDDITDYTEAWDGDLDEGIGKAAALTEAQAVLTEMKTAGLISAGEISSSPFSQTPMVHHIYDPDRDQTLKLVDWWTFRFYSTLDNIPVVDNFVEVDIGRGGTRMKIALQRVTKTFSANVNTTISKADALTTLVARAEDYFQIDANSRIWMGNTMPVYQLQPEATSALVTPSLTAKISPVGPEIDTGLGGVVGFAVVANLNFVSPESTLNVYSPWGGRRPTVEGSTCSEDSDCDATGAPACYPNPTTCGACDEDSDCPIVGGKPGRCHPPNPFTGMGAQCVNGTTGAVCTTNSDCTSTKCATLFSNGLLGTVKTCGGCINDVFCSGSTPRCKPALNFSTWRLDKSCRAAGANGTLCDTNDDCTSNKCYLGTGAGGTGIGGLGYGTGVCSACTIDADCTGGQVCKPPKMQQTTGVFTPAACGAP